MADYTALRSLVGRGAAADYGACALSVMNMVQCSPVVATPSMYRAHSGNASIYDNRLASCLPSRRLRAYWCDLCCNERNHDYSIGVNGHTAKHARFFGWRSHRFTASCCGCFSTQSEDGSINCCCMSSGAVPLHSL